MRNELVNLLVHGNPIWYGGYRVCYDAVTGEIELRQYHEREDPMARRRYQTVVICGSMRFYDQMLDAAGELSQEGYVVLMPFVAFPKQDQHTDVKAMLDDMHFQKIDMAHHVVVITDAAQYIGESTANEIRYAQSKGKTAYIWSAGDRMRPALPQNETVTPA